MLFRSLGSINIRLRTLETLFQKTFVVLGLFWLATFGGICDDSTPVTPNGTGHLASITVSLAGTEVVSANVFVDGASVGEVSTGGSVSATGVEPDKTHVVKLVPFDPDLGAGWETRSVDVKPQTNHRIEFSANKATIKVNLGVECIGTISSGRVQIDVEPEVEILAGGQVTKQVTPGEHGVLFRYGTSGIKAASIKALFGGTYTWNIDC